MLTDPKLGGGIRSTTDMFFNYLKSEKKDLELLINYAKRLRNGDVFKRLGFLLERYAPEQKTAIDECKSQLTTGNVKLDPALKGDKLITRWRLWVPNSWMKGN
jgi:predicted transcriptional regulator of viral defense system